MDAPSGRHTEVAPHVLATVEVQFLHSATARAETLVWVLRGDPTGYHMTVGGGARFGTAEGRGDTSMDRSQGLRDGDFHRKAQDSLIKVDVRGVPGVSLVEPSNLLDTMEWHPHPNLELRWPQVTAQSLPPSLPPSLPQYLKLQCREVDICHHLCAWMLHLRHTHSNADTHRARPVQCHGPRDRTAL